MELDVFFRLCMFFSLLLVLAPTLRFVAGLDLHLAGTAAERLVPHAQSIGTLRRDSFEKQFKCIYIYSDNFMEYFHAFEALP